MTNITASSKARTTPSKVKKPRKPRTARQKLMDAAIAAATTAPARRQAALAGKVAGMPEVAEWESYKTAIHGAVVSRSHCLLENLLTIRCADGTIHNRSLSRRDRGVSRPVWDDDSGDYGPPMMGHGLGSRG